MKPYAELLEYNQPNLYRKEGFTRIRDAFPELKSISDLPVDWNGNAFDTIYNPESIVEFAGRWDYGEKNAKRLGETVRVARPENGPEAYEDVPIIQKYIDMGHESMLEMADATFFIECSRVVSHELVRHRIASYQQESQRFVKYDDEKPEDLFYVPEFIPEQWGEVMMAQNVTALENYKNARSQGMAPQLARYVLPNAMRTRLVMKTNLREWRHICKLRLDKSAQPEMRELMQQIYDQLVDIFPNVMYNAIDGERGVR